MNNADIIIAIALCLLLAYHVSSATFDISSVSTCTQESENGYCVKWEQNGTVTEQIG